MEFGFGFLGIEVCCGLWVELAFRGVGGTVVMVSIVGGSLGVVGRLLTVLACEWTSGVGGDYLWGQ